MGDADGAPQPEWAVGCQVTLSTTLGEELVGTIFAFDKAHGCLVLKQAGSHNGVANLRILKTNYIKEVVSASKPDETLDTKLPYVDIQRCKDREEKAIRAAEASAAKIGVGVTKEAQAIFDALSKTMPCNWHEKTIVVLDGVRVEPPYVSESCSAPPEHKVELERVRTVLKQVRANLGYKD